MNNSTITLNLIIMLITFVFAAFFVGAEFALVQTRPSALEDDLENNRGNKKKLTRALKMTHNLNEYLSTTQVGVTLASIILGWLGESTAEEIFINLFKNFPKISPAIGHTIGIVLGVVILTYLEVVLTEIVPKNIAIDLPVKTLMFVVNPLTAFHILFYPFVKLLNDSSNFVVKLLGFPPADEGNQVLTQTEILSLSKNSISGGDMDKNDVVFMQRAFALNDKTARDIMIDRTSLFVIDIQTTVKEALVDYLKEGYSRFPVVANNDKDRILGYVYVYDLVRQSQTDDTIKVSKLLRTMHSVPENTPINLILKNMINRRTPMVAVVDEYGGTSGIITDKDIYEELFGTIRDEIDDISDDYITKSDTKGVYDVSGKTTLYDFERYFQTKLPEFDNSDIITIAGYILENFDNLHVGKKIDIDEFRFEITEYSHSYPNEFTVTKIPESELPKKETEDDDE